MEKAVVAQFTRPAPVNNTVARFQLPVDLEGSIMKVFETLKKGEKQ